MADNGMLIGLAVVGIGGYLLWQSGALSGLGGGGATGTPVPVTQQTGNFQESQLVTRTPGIGSIVITPDIIIQARPDFLMPITFCAFDRQRDDDDDNGHNIHACCKIWEQEHNHQFHTIKERNEHTLMRCRIISFFLDIDFRRDFDDPIRQHICLNKRIIIDECRKGRRDSPKVNSAALDCAQVTAPIIQNCNKCTVNVNPVSAPPINITNTNINNNQLATGPSTQSITNKAPAPGASAPPIPLSHPSAQGATTTPTTPQACPAGHSWSASLLRCVGPTISNKNLNNNQLATGPASQTVKNLGTAKAAYGWAY